MKKLIFIWCMFVCVLFSACSSVTTETADVANTDTVAVEAKVVARAVVNGKCDDMLHVLCTDGECYSMGISYDCALHCLQKGDTVLIKNGKIWSVRFCL